MPFTFAHPAAVLPFLRVSSRAGWATGLVTGSLAPDLLRPLFSFEREVTHSLGGVAFLDTPIAIMAAWLVHRYLVPRLRRIPGLDDPQADEGRFSLALASLGAFLGGITHVVWDSFTHDQAPFTRGGILDTILFWTPAGPFMLGQTIWFACSGGGILAILAWLLLRIRKSGPGLKALRSWTWARLLALPGLPFLGLLAGFRTESGNLPKDLFIHVFYRSGDLAPYLLVPSVAIFVGLFWWETRPPRHTPQV